MSGQIPGIHKTTTTLLASIAVLVCLAVVLFNVLPPRIQESTQASQAVVATDDWGQWGGPNRNFSVSGSFAEFTPKIVWQRGIGAGHSAVVVKDEAAIVCYKQGKSEAVEKLTANQGRSLWKTEVPVTYQPSGGRYDGPHSTPLIFNSLIYHVSIDGVARSFYLADGKVGWKYDLKTTGMSLPQAGYGSSPILARNLLVLPTLGDSIAAETEFFDPKRKVGKVPGAIALDPLTGKLLWKSDSFRSSHASPVEISIGDQNCLVFHGMFELVGLDPETGKILWRHLLRKTAADNVSFTPLWDPKRNQIVISHGYCDVGTQAISIDYSDSKWQVKTAWKNRDLKIVHTNAVLVGDLFVGTNRSPATSQVEIDLSSGKTLRRLRGTKKANFLVAGKSCLRLEEDGRLSVLNLESATQGIRHPVLSGSCWTVPTVTENRVFLRNDSQIKVMSLESPRR